MKNNKAEDLNLERKALYNLVRMNWMEDQSLEVNSWLVEDYRSLDLATLLERLKQLGFSFEKEALMLYFNDFDSPEDFTDNLFENEENEEVEIETQDQVFLLIFELWRRLYPEKLSLSVFCDELDHQIHLYDGGELKSSEKLQDLLLQLKDILEENFDRDMDQEELFNSLLVYCANDVENFINDFIADLIELESYEEALEIIDAFYDYVSDISWFEFFRAKALVFSEPEQADELIENLVEELLENPQLDLMLEAFSFCAKRGEKGLLLQLFEKIIVLIQVEEELQTLIDASVDYFSVIDDDDKEQTLQKLLDSRENYDLEEAVSLQDPAIKMLSEFLGAKISC